MPAKEAKATPSEPRAAAPDPKRYGIYGPDSKADPHMARAAALREYHRLRDSGAATAEASDDAGVAEGASTLENLQYLPGSKSGFGGLGLRGQKRLPRGPKPGLGKPPKGKAP